MFSDVCKLLYIYSGTRNHSKNLSARRFYGNKTSDFVVHEHLAIVLEFRVDEGFEVLERLRQRVNLWPQTLLSFQSANGRSLLVLIPYRLTGGGMPATEVQATLFHAYAYKRAADFAYGSTGRQVVEY